ncbi:unnamed protein product, partial [Ectocarpus sp. 12 AP-2014]
MLQQRHQQVVGPASVAGSPDRTRRSRVPHGSITRSSSSASTSVGSSAPSLSQQSCGVCEAEFTRLRRPHRCRRCMEAVCASCSPLRLPVPGSGSLEPKRTCRLCAGGPSSARRK